MHAPRQRSIGRRLAALSVASVVAGALLAGCGSSGGSDAGTSDEPTATDGGGTVPTAGEDATTTSEPDTGGGDLEGSWTADASDLIAANTANVGGPGGMECSGPISLNFGADGSFSQTGAASCTVGGQAATMNFDNSGTYTVDGSTISLDGMEDNSTVDIGGVSTPTEMGMGSSTAEYGVDGDTLTITFTIEPTGTVVQTYTRS